MNIQYSKFSIQHSAFWLLTVLVGFLAPNFSYGLVPAYPTAGGNTKAGIIAAGYAVDDVEIGWEQDVVMMATSQSPFADNMMGGPGSGKPIINHPSLADVKGNQIVITTVDPFGGPMVSRNGTRFGLEEAVKPGDFRLTCDIGWFGAAIDNTGKAQTIVGAEWEDISQENLGARIAKQQSDDCMVNLKHAAGADNIVYPNGKQFDTLGSADTFQTSLIVKSRGTLSDLGAIPVDTRQVSLQAQGQGKIGRYMQFTTEQNARPIKLDSLYLEGIKLAQQRGENNSLFNGDFSEWDNNVLYPWQNVRHGGNGSIGSALQPEALLGVAIVAKATSSNLSAVLIKGGGSAANAAETPYRNYFEFFSRFAYVPINATSVTFGAAFAAAVTGAFNPRATYGYLAIQNRSDGLISYFRYTTNTVGVGATTQNTISGLKRLGSTDDTDYLTTIGDMTWNSASLPAAGDGAGFPGLSEGAIDIGSKIYEVNSKGVPIGFGFGLGEMALVCGYGRIPLPNGGFKSRLNRTEHVGPHNQNFGKGVEVSWGTAAFKRPDTVTPNYTLNVFARQIDGFPVIA